MNKPIQAHTPGPWLANGTHITHQQNPGGYRFDIAEVSRDVGSQSAKANARLIASSPELLEALRYYVNLHEANILNMPEVNENEGKAWKRTLAIARTTIAKATGGAIMKPCLQWFLIMSTFALGLMFLFLAIR